MLFESVSEYRVSGGSGGLRNTRITKRRRNSLSLLMILILKSTQNLGVITECNGREFGRGVSSMLILRLPDHRWSLPLVGEEGDG